MSGPALAPVYYTHAPESCDSCEGSFNQVMYDARVPGRGSWGNLCQSCFTHFGCQLGTGRGQKYQRQPDGRWLKTAG